MSPWRCGNTDCWDGWEPSTKECNNGENTPVFGRQVPESRRLPGGAKEACGCQGSRSKPGRHECEQGNMALQAAGPLQGAWPQCLVAFTLGELSSQPRAILILKEQRKCFPRVQAKSYEDSGVGGNHYRLHLAPPPRKLGSHSFQVLDVPCFCHSALAYWLSCLTPLSGA